MNAQRREARRGQSFDQAWTDFHNTRAELIGMLAEWDDERLAREMDAPFDWARTAYGWFVGQTIWHDREHAEVLRAL